MGTLLPQVDRWGDVYRACKGKVDMLAYAEDKDTSGGAAAITTMGGSIFQTMRKDGSTTAYVLRRGRGQPRLMAAIVCSEQASVGWYISINNKPRKIRIKPDLDACGFFMVDFSRSGGVPLKEGSEVSVVAGVNASISQLGAILMVHYPDLPAIQMVDPLKIREHEVLGKKVGTRVAATFGPLSGTPITSFEDSEADLSTQSDDLYALLGIINGPGLVDTCIMGVRHPTIEHEYLIPTSMAEAGNDVLFSGPDWIFHGEAPPKVGAHGASVTSDEYTFWIGRL